jgi:hypothetical protein
MKLNRVDASYDTIPKTYPLAGLDSTIPQLKFVSCEVVTVRVNDVQSTERGNRLLGFRM